MDKLTLYKKYILDSTTSKEPLKTKNNSKVKLLISYLDYLGILFQYIVKLHASATILGYTMYKCEYYF